MFKLNIPVTKSYVAKNTNVLVIEWIATDSTIDRDFERFSEEAIKGMHDSVNEWWIPVKVEHGNNIFSEIGVWKEASFTEDWKVFVRGEIDLDLSMGRDIQVLLNKWFEIALSVWGMVKDAISEFNAELWKSIKTYTDVILKEISVVKNPSNYNATLSLAKSFNVDEKKETEEAIALSKNSEGTIIASSTFDKSLKEIEDLIKGTIMTKDSVFIKWIWEPIVSKCCDDSCIEPCYDCYETTGLKYYDYKIIGMIYRIYSVVGTDEIKEPEWLDRESVEELPNYSFLPLKSDARLIPYMSADLKIRKDWVIYSMYRLAKWEFSRINASDRSYAMEFLYAAYKQLLVTSKNFEVSWTREIRGDEVVLMQKCIKYKVEKGSRPQYEGNDLSDVEINKLAKAYSVLIDRNILKTNSNKTMNEAELKILIAKYTSDLAALEVTKSEDVATEEVAVEEVKVEEVAVEVAAEEAPVEEVKVVGEEVATEEVATEEPNTDTTKNNTSIDEALLKAISSAVETASKSTLESIVALEKSFNEKLEAMSAETLTKSAKVVSDKETENAELMTKMVWAIDAIAAQVEVIWKSKGDRKSFATDIQKGYVDKTAGKSQEDLISAEMDKNGGNLAAARTAVLSAV